MSRLEELRIGSLQFELDSECSNSFIEMCTALFILVGRYEPKYADRARIFKKLYFNEFPDLAKVLPDLRARIITHPDRPEIIQFVISKAIDRLKKEKVSLIVCSMMKNNPYYKVFRENGFVRHSGSHILALADPSKVSEMFVKDPNNWYLTLGDSDGIGL